MANAFRKHKPKLKKLRDQAIVITGATSGIGLATARMAAKRGAQLVLAARNEEALQQLADELQRSGHEVVTVVADVSREHDVRRIATAATKKFGGFDTWINNAAVSMYGRLLDVPLDDERQLFETNYWGTVHGSRVAVEHLRQYGGALINIGSANSDYAAPLQGTFSASKHAVKGYTDALRMELEATGAPVSVTLVKPSPIDTPYPRHARNHLATDPKLTPPVYAPEVAAEAILYCAQHPKRDVYVGAAGRIFATAGRFAPKFSDRIMSWLGSPLQETGRRTQNADSLYAAGQDMHVRGDYPGHVMRSSIYTKVALRPKRTGALLLATGAAAGLLWRANQKRNGKATVRVLSRKGEEAAHVLPKFGRKIRGTVERRLPL